MKTSIFTSKQISNFLNMKQAIHIVEKVYEDHGNHRALLPPKINLPMGENGEWPHFYGSSNAMPAYVHSLEAMGIKFVSGYKNNYSKNLPFIHGLIILTDRKTGVPISVMDGSYITAIRTGAATAVGLKHLKFPAKKIGVIGAGLQGEMNIVALNEVLDIEQCLVFDSQEEKFDLLKEKLHSKVDFPISFASPEDLCRNSEVIVACTTANQPLIFEEWLNRPCIVVPLGSYQEVDDCVIEKSTEIVVDSIAQSIHRGELKRFFSDGRLTSEDIFAELGEIVVNSKTVNIKDNSLVVLAQIGMGSLDIGIAKVVYDELSQVPDHVQIQF